MKATVAWLVLMFVVLLSGCGGERDKDINKGQDRPVPADKK